MLLEGRRSADTAVRDALAEEPARTPAPGRTTLAMRDDAGGGGLGFDDYRVLGLRDVLRYLGADHPLRDELLAASDRSIAGRAMRWRELPRAAAPTAAGHALRDSAERHAATLYRHAIAAGGDGPAVDDPAVASALQQRGSGEPLPAAIRGEMERELGMSLAGVRVHTDGVAARAATALRAEAFAVGQDIFFAAGAFAPDSRVGRKLLAHELAHVAQALRGQTASSGRGAQVSHPDDPLEREADAVAERVDAKPAAPAPAPGSAARAPVPSPRADGPILRQAGAPRPPGSLPAATNAFRGIELEYLVESLPQTQGTPIAYLIDREPYIIAPHVLDRDTSPRAVYYTAYRKRTRQIEFIIGPDSLSGFLARIMDYQLQGGISYMFGPPAPHVRESVRSFRAVLYGRFGEAGRALARAWAEAVRDPSWWLQMVTAGAGAARASAVPRPPGAPPALRVLPGGGGSSAGGVAPSTAVPVPATIGNAALVASPQVVAVAPPQLRVIVNPSPMPLATPLVTRPVPAQLALAAVTIGAGVRPSSPPAQAPQPAPQPATRPAQQREPRRPLQVRLLLPSVKIPHLGLYEAMVREGRLGHQVAYDRGSSAQVRKWDDAVRPGGSQGMTWGTFQHGLRLGVEPERILRPNWSRLSATIPMEVDHVVELQLVRSSDRGWADSISNYELLDRSSNRSAGPQLQNNIRRERERLVRETGDAGWRTRDLIFTQVVPMPGDLGQRWRSEEIQDGLHLVVLQRQLGERDGDR